MSKKALNFKSGELYRIPATELLLVGRDEDVSGGEWEDHPLYSQRALREADEAMVQSILELGILQSIRATKLPEIEGGQPVVELGRGRVIAAREAQRRIDAAAMEAGDIQPPPIMVPVTYVRYNPMRAGAHVLAENAQRQAVDPLTEAEDMGRLVDRCEDIALVAVATGYTKATIRNRLKLLELSAKVQRAVRAEKLAPSAALTLHGKPAAEQNELLTKLLEEFGTTGKKVTTRKAKKAQGKNQRMTIKSIRVASTDETLKLAVLADALALQTNGKDSEVIVWEAYCWGMAKAAGMAKPESTNEGEWPV